MLVSLTIRDLAIIEDSTFELTAGLNVLTGETGAGKSIIIEALSLVLGDRAELDLVRRGKERAEVEAVFALSASSPTRARLEALELSDPHDPEACIIRRVVAASGKGRVYVNGHSITVSTLAELTRGLVDVSSQHQHTQLLDPSTHLEMLDRFGSLHALKATFLSHYQAYEEAQRHLKSLKAKDIERLKREEFVRFQLAELEELKLVEGEDEELEAEHVRLSHADRLLQGASEASALVGATPSAQSASERLLNAQRILDRLKQHDPTLMALAERLESLRIEVGDVGAELKHYTHHIELDPRRLDYVCERLDRLKHAKKKFGATISDILATQASLRSELSGFESLELDIHEAERALERAKAAAQAAAKDLSEGRHQAKGELEQRISEELHALALSGSGIRFELAPLLQLSLNGAEMGEIHIQTNKGEAWGPLHKTASGGELARVLLALKRALMHVETVETCIFDEVDTGTGGAVGDMIGRTLQAIASERQVLCITHLPQIAARGQKHLKVLKDSSGERTVTRVIELEDTARIDEIARMLGGIDITRTTREHASELIARAQH